MNFIFLQQFSCAFRIPFEVVKQTAQAGSSKLNSLGALKYIVKTKVGFSVIINQNGRLHLVIKQLKQIPSTKRFHEIQINRYESYKSQDLKNMLNTSFYFSGCVWINKWICQYGFQRSMFIIKCFHFSLLRFILFDYFSLFLLDSIYSDTVSVVGIFEGIERFFQINSIKIFAFKLKLDTLN